MQCEVGFQVASEWYHEIPPSSMIPRTGVGVSLSADYPAVVDDAQRWDATSASLVLFSTRYIRCVLPFFSLCTFWWATFVAFDFPSKKRENGGIQREAVVQAITAVYILNIFFAMLSLRRPFPFLVIARLRQLSSRSSLGHDCSRTVFVIV